MSSTGEGASEPAVVAPIQEEHVEVDVIDTRGARYTSASGTATRILSTGFGELESQGDGAQIELRASWTPDDHDVASHVEGWGELLCMLAGLPPAVEGVSLLSARRVGRE